MKHCHWCDSSFSPSVSYQIYCSGLCRTEATKEKIAERYIKQRMLKDSHKQRKCKSCGKTLSVYNNEKICARCEVNPSDVIKVLKEIKDIADGKDKLS
jgi:hypothetical protein